MANFELKFLCDSKDGTSIQVQEKSSAIVIQLNTSDNQFHQIWIDKSTAIKFAKTLRTEINKIDESEAQNG